MLETSKDLLAKFKKNERGREKSRGRKKVAAFSRNDFSLDLLINGFPPPKLFVILLELGGDV